MVADRKGVMMRQVFRRSHNNIWEKEWNRLLSQEQKFIYDRQKRKSLGLNDKIEKVMPANMQETLDKAFIKGFKLIFEKGTGVVEKTFNKKKIENEYKINQYAMKLEESPESVRKFRRQAAKSKNFNMAVSAVEGGAFGIFGVGVPDIPVFTGVMLKSVYEIALHYGFEYTSEEEQVFILKLIETSLSFGTDLRKKDILLNRWIAGEKEFTETKEVQMVSTADRLSEELLYMKFLQTLPIVGIVGGAVDVWCLEQITSYAQLKYQRRFLQNKKNDRKKPLDS